MFKLTSNVSISFFYCMEVTQLTIATSYFMLVKLHFCNVNIVKIDCHVFRDYYFIQNSDAYQNSECSLVINGHIDPCMCYWF